MTVTSGLRQVDDRGLLELTTRRGAAVAGQIPAGAWPTALGGTGAISQGQQPAYQRLAIPTRANQKGGTSTPAAPTRRACPTRSPPPSR